MKASWRISISVAAACSTLFAISALALDKELEYSKLPDYLKTLNLATAFNGRNTGIDFSQSVEFKAFVTASKQGASIKDELHYLLRVATPAGKLYSALLLRKLDEEEGDSALEDLLENSEKVRYGLWGCKYSVMPTSEVAAELLNHGDSIVRFFDTSSPSKGVAHSSKARKRPLHKRKRSQ